jgi:hypothetical protein
MAENGTVQRLTPGDGKSKDDEHLDLLAVFHYIVGGLIGIFACLPLIHLVLGLLMLFAPAESWDGTPPPRFMGWLFAGVGGIFILVGWTIAIFMIVAGRRLAKRTHYRYCFVMACIACTFMPFGTVLGVFTIVVLMRDSVKASFAGRDHATSLQA